MLVPEVEGVLVPEVERVPLHVLLDVAVRLVDHVQHSCTIERMSQGF